MAFTITGKIQEIGTIENIPYKDKVFQKRTLVLNASRYNSITGEQYENYPKFEMSGSHVNELDTFQVGQLVTVSFALSGRRYEKNGEVNYYTNIQAFKVEPYTKYGGQPQNDNVYANAPSTPTPQSETNVMVESSDLPF